MGSGRWSRWGRGSCEGYGLEFGHLLRYSVVRQRNEGGDYWRATLNARELGIFPTLDEAQAAVEAHAREEIGLLAEHWAAFNARPSRGRRARKS